MFVHTAIFITVYTAINTNNTRLLRGHRTISLINNNSLIFFQRGQFAFVDLFDEMCNFFQTIRLHFRSGRRRSEPIIVIIVVAIDKSDTRART